MPDPAADPHLASTTRIARRALAVGVGITALKFLIFALTASVAVLSDALESIINLVAGAFVLYSLWLSNRPADRSHPYGHGKVEFLAVGFEGAMILVAGLIIAVTAIARLISGRAPGRLDLGLILLIFVAVFTVALAAYVWHAGKRYDNLTLIADGKHLATDAASTLGVLVGLTLVKLTGYAWLDPVVAIVLASFILWTSWRLLWDSIGGLMDRSDPDDDRLINEILDDEVTQGQIVGYHKVRHRHTGRFHWVDMHLQVPGDMSVALGHDIASRIEGRIEQALGEANATAHLEPASTLKTPSQDHPLRR